MRETKQCKKCQGTKWTKAGLCFACEDLPLEVTKCTRDSHGALQESFRAFKVGTIRHRPWKDAEFEINMLQGDCPLCKSTLYWNFNSKPNSTAHLGSLSHEELKCIVETSVLKMGIRRQARRLMWAIEDAKKPAITSTQALVFAVTR
jgi:hypothetical protein